MFITKTKKDQLRRYYIDGTLVRATGLKRNTIRYYLNEFKVLKQDYPEKLNDFDFN